jgi:hypothetical protein
VHRVEFRVLGLRWVRWEWVICGKCGRKILAGDVIAKLSPLTAELALRIG